MFLIEIRTNGRKAYSSYFGS